MFFEITLLCPQYRGKFAFAWIAATRGVKHLSQKQILSTDIEKICHDIMTMLITQSQVPKARLSLSLAARLVNGTIKIFYQKTLFLQKNLTEYHICISRPPSKPEPVDKRRKKKRAVVSDEVNRPAADDAIIPELQITDRDVEKALQDAPSATVDSITLRDEIPRRTMPFEEEGGFGEEGITEQFVVPTVVTDTTEVTSRVLRAKAPRLPPQEILDTLDIHPPELISKLSEPLENIEIRRPETPKKRKLPVVTEKESLSREEPVEKRPETPKKHKLPEVTEQELMTREEEPVQKRPETPKKHKLPEVAEKDVFVKPKGPARKIVKLNKVLVKSKLQPRSNFIQLDKDDELFKETYDLTIDVSIYKNIQEEWEDMLPQSVFDLSIDRGRAQESRSSQRTGSFSGLRRKSRSTPVGAAHDQRDTIPGSRPVESVDEAALVQTPVLAEIPLLQIDRIQPPEAELPLIPISHSTAIRSLTLDERDFVPVPLEPIREDVPRVEIPVEEEVSSQRLEIPIAEQEIPLLEQEIPLQRDVPVCSPSARRQEIIRIVKAWNFEARDLTVEDVCVKPVNRLNVAVAFSDLLCKLTATLNYSQLARKVIDKSNGRIQQAQLL